jgi:hypothetical protein
MIVLRALNWGVLEIMLLLLGVIILVVIVKEGLRRVQVNGKRGVFGVLYIVVVEGIITKRRKMIGIVVEEVTVMGWSVLTRSRGRSLEEKGMGMLEVVLELVVLVVVVMVLIGR